MKSFKAIFMFVIFIPYSLYALEAGDKLDSLTTVDGKTYVSVIIREINTEGVIILHETGVKKIAAKNLPPEMQKTLDLDPTAAEEAMKTRIEAENTARRNAMQQRIDSIKDLKNSRRLTGIVLQVNQDEKSVIVKLNEECRIISSREEKNQRIENSKGISSIGKSLCKLRKKLAFGRYDDIYSHKCNHCSAPLEVGQPFVLFRLLGCIVVGGIGLGIGI